MMVAMIVIAAVVVVVIEIVPVAECWREQPEKSMRLTLNKELGLNGSKEEWRF